MLRHIVMFKLKGTKEAEKKQYSQQLKSAIEALPESVEQVKFMEVGENINQNPSAYDLVLVSDFENEEALNIYRNHPEHVKVIEIIQSLVASIHVVDYIV
ncbi:MAG: Dabb family protein [Bacteroidales bacterium]|nr:Dabb family protein [Bacteroidales bacterium]